MKKLVIIAGLALCTVSVVAKNPNFNIKNKTPDNIIIKIKQGQGFDESSVGFRKASYKLNNTDKNKLIKSGIYTMGTPVRIKKDRSFSLELETQEDLAGTVYELDVAYVNSLHQLQTLSTTLNLQQNGTFYIKAQKKDGKFMLAPQEGRFGKTTEGYSLKNNVPETDLVNQKIIPDISFKNNDVIDLE